MRTLIALSCFAAAMIGCSDDAGSGTPSDGGGPTSFVHSEVSGAVCGGGGPLGVAISESAASEDLVVFLNGGGACWDAASCFVLNSATHIQGVSPETIVAEAVALESWLFDRADGPFPTANYAFVPYCTGDLYSGTETTTYQVGLDQRQVHHQGANNVDAILAALKQRFPRPRRIWLVGASAGGFGATINWWRFRRDFPGVAVDVIADSSPPIDPTGARWAEWTQAWSPQFDPECAGCTAGFSALLPHYQETIPATERFALPVYRQDAVIALYFGLDGAQVAARVAALSETLTGDGREFFELEGTEHVVVTNPEVMSGGVTVNTWLRQMIENDPAWTSIRP